MTTSGSNSSMSSNKPIFKTCYNCGGKIRLLPDPTGKTKPDGKLQYLPYNDFHPFDRHRCLNQTSQYKSMPNTQKAKGIECRSCKAPIMFSADQKTESGKWIPLEMTGEPHQCPVKQQQYQQQQQQQQQQQRQPQPQRDDYYVGEQEEDEDAF